MTRHLIIGGSDAGISAALRIRELDPTADVTVVAAEAYPNFSICGLPFFLSGEVPDWRNLAHRQAPEIEAHGIGLQLNQRAEKIDPAARTVLLVAPDGAARHVKYDRLLVATGAESVRPPIEGLDAPGVFFLRWMDDSFAVKALMDRRQPRRAVVVGGGYIGLEMADALTRRGLAVTLMEFAPEVLTTLDPELGALIRAELEAQGVHVITGQAVKRIARQTAGLVVQTADGGGAATDMVIVAAGARPSTNLATTAGIGTGAGGAIRADRTMATSVADIWAAGDCAETWHRMLARNVYLPLGTTAHKQGRVAGENMLGGKREFQGSLGTQVVKVFDRVAARSGLRDREAREAGFDPLTVALTVWDHKVYYPGANRIHLRLTGDRGSGRLLGVQVVGRRTAEIAK
ncbi:MAG: FAD-dependent oxidoreductase, partial [Desulfobacteraceae bacterium]|nr:FAD-dependent oxidoreductase [Desulfobacteraceae bacterium]